MQLPGKLWRRFVVTTALCTPLLAAAGHAQEEVTIDKSVVVIHRDYGNDMPAFSPNANVIAVCGDERLRFLDPAGKRLAQWPKSEGYPREVAWFPSGKHVVTRGDIIEFWEIPSGKQIMDFDRTVFAGGDREVYYAKVAVSPDGKSVAIGFQTGDIAVASLADRTKKVLLNGGHAETVSRLVWNGNTVFSAGGYGDGKVCLWNAATGKQQLQIAADAREVRGLAVHPDGKSLLTIGSNNEVVLWNATTGEAITRFAAAAEVEPGGLKPGAVAFLSKGEVVAAGQGSDLMLWKIDGQQLGRFPGHDSWIRALDVSPDGTRLISAGGSTMRIWSVPDLLKGNSEDTASSQPPMPSAPSSTRGVGDLNDIANWTIVDGTWKQQGKKLVGSGFSHLQWKQHFPNDFTFSMNMRVVGDTSPRVRFGSFHFGNEGNAKTLFLHGPKATGEPFPYQLEQEIAVEVQVKAGQATLKINGQEVARSNPKTLENRTLTLQAGGKQSTGSTEFYDLKLKYD